MEKNPFILTLRMDETSQAFFNRQREAYFPRQANFLDAHLSLFHQLSDRRQTLAILSELKQKSFTISASGMQFLGYGVAYRLESAMLSEMHKVLAAAFRQQLTGQDRQGFRGHVTVQNKVDAASAKSLFAKLNKDFEVFEVQALGLDLWIYMGGPWKHYRYFPFKPA